MTRLQQAFLTTPIGRLRLVASPRALVGVYFPDHPGAPEILPRARDHAILERAAAELEAYFAGQLREFSTPLEPSGTEFQRAVWGALPRIDFGATASYAGLARIVGRPRAARAIGAANARNPLSLFLPCHRVVGSDGSLTGYAGGLARKRWLLDHELRVLRGAELRLRPPKRRAER